MGKISNRLVRQPQESKVHWKDSALFSTIVAVVGTASFMYAVVLPILNSSLNAKLEALQPVIKKAEKLEAEVESLKEKLATTERDLKEASRQIAISQLKAPFAAGSIYPSGLEKVKIGDSFSLVEKAYPQGKWSEEHSYYSAEINHPIFRHITFYSNGTQKTPKVNTILFIMKFESPFTTESLRQSLESMLGAPQQTSGNHRAWWGKLPRVSIAIQGDRLYHIYSKEYSPAWVR